MCCSGTLLSSAKVHKAWVGRIFLRCGSKSQKLLMSLEKNKIIRVLRPQSRQTTCGLRTNPPPQKDAFKGSAHQRYCALWGNKSVRSEQISKTTTQSGQYLWWVLPSKAPFYGGGFVLSPQAICPLWGWNLCGRSKSKKLPPKQTIPLMGTALKSAFLWGRICFKPASSLSALGPKDLHGFVLFKRHE